MASKKPAPSHPRKPSDLDLDRLKGRLFSIKYGAREQEFIPYNYAIRVDALQNLRDQYYEQTLLANKKWKAPQLQSQLFGIITMGILLGWARSKGKINHEVFLRLMDNLITRTQEIERQS